MIEAGRVYERQVLVPLVEEPPATPTAWSAKDNLAHLTAWRMTASAEFDAVRTGSDSQDFTEETDEINAKIYSETHDLPVDTVLINASTSWDSLLDAVNVCSDQDLYRPRKRRTEQEAWQMVPANAYFHLAQHLNWFFSERGDFDAAEKAAHWAHETATSAFAEDERRGAADYNLGCFYAMHGRADQAMPYLESGVRLRPDLLTFAREDTDLDPIRSNTSLRRLLGDVAQ